MKKILIVEDVARYQEEYAKALQDKVIIIAARSLAEAWKFFVSNTDLDLIVMDACVNNDERPDTRQLVSDIRKTFKGPMIASSGLSDYRDWLVQWGCDHKSAKHDVPEKVLEVLQI